MKKLLILLLAAAMLLSLAACGGGTSAEEPSRDGAAEENSKSNRGQGLDTSFTFCGIVFSIPFYYEEDSELDGNYFSYYKGGKIYARIFFGEEDLSGSQEEFDEHKDKITENMMGSMEVADLSPQLLDSNDTTLAGLSARRFTLAINNNSNKHNTHTTFTYNYAEGKLVGVTYYDFGQDPDFLDDYYQMIETATLAAASNQVTYTPFTIAGIEFLVPSYYEQEDTDFNYYKYGELYAAICFDETDFSGTLKEFYEKMDHFIDNSMNDDKELLESKDIILAGLSTRYFSYRDSNNYTAYITATYNYDVEKVALVSYTSLDSDLLNDYYQMIETATLAEAGKSTVPATPPESNVSSAPTSGIRPEFKEAMDSYEAFFDEYIDFMERYTSSNNILGMLTDYTEYITKYAEAMTELEKINDGTLSSEELAYYLDVQNRITQKLLTVAQ